MDIFLGQVKKFSLIHWAMILLIIGALSGCANEGLTETNTAASSSDRDSDNTVIVEMGSGTGDSFTAGTLSIASTSLSAGGATTITVTLQESSGVLHTDSTSITFSSNCTALGLASLDSPVTTTTGVAISNYVATGCSGSDTISASAVINDTSITASGSLTVAEASLGSIQFLSATPELIALQGTGGVGLSENSTVVFKVLDEAGGPVIGETVTFDLNTTVGGLSLSPTTAISGADGTVQTTVLSGTIPTPVRVTATVTVDDGTEASTQSDQLVVSTGIPDQDSFSLSASKFNVEGWDYDGKNVTITARLADRFNNPVPDGTAVSFTTEGGSIESSCATSNGQCSVTWTSQNPRPCGQESGKDTVTLSPPMGPNVCISSGGTNADISINPQDLGQPYGGRATILATAVGEESFSDVNGNGIFDDGESHVDLPEAWRDDDENDTRDSYEMFLDFDEDGSYDAKDNAFNGVLCNQTAASPCSESTTLHIRQKLVLVMSRTAVDAAICIDDGDGCGSTIDVSNGGIKSVSVYYSDVHNQPLPLGTTVSTACTIGSVTDGDDTVLSTNANGPGDFSFTYEGPESTGGDSGTCTITVTTPQGHETSERVNVTEAP